MNQKLPSQAYKCLASYSRVSTAQACRIYQVVGTGTNCYGPELDQHSYNNLSMHTHELIMQRPLSLESLSSEPTLSWLEHTVHVTVWTCSCGQLPVSPSMSRKQICAWFPSICPACSSCSMTIYILALPIIPMTGSLILGYQCKLSLSGIVTSFYLIWFGRKHELLASVFNDLRDTNPCLLYQPVCCFPTHRRTEPKIFFSIW